MRSRNLPPALLRVEPVEERRAGCADVQVPGWRWSEADANHNQWSVASGQFEQSVASEMVSSLSRNQKRTCLLTTDH